MTNYKKSYTDHGGDGDVVVLLHGFLASSKYWNKILPLLASKGLRVITIDLLGFGDAPKPKGSSYDYRAHTEHVGDVIALLGINQPFTLVGHSMGALVASHFTNDNPDKVKSLVLLHPPLYKNRLDARKTLRSTNGFYRFLLDSKYRRIGWIFLKLTLHSQIGRHTLLAREKSLQNIIEPTKIFAELENTTVSTLLFIGNKDRPQYADNLKTATLSDRVVVVKANVAHHSPVRNPRFVHETIWQFLNTASHNLS